MAGSSARHRDEARSPHSDRVINKWTIVPLAACLYAVVLHPVILSFCGVNDFQCLQETPPINKVFWPVLFLASIVLLFQGASRFSLPKNLMAFLAYLVFAGLSVLWAYKHDLSFVRFTQQVMIVTSIAIPALLADRDVDMTRVLYVCFGFAAILNLFYVMGPPIIPKHGPPGYSGYFLTKNYLGQFAAVALLLALRELLYSGRRRLFGALVAFASLVLVYLSNSKTSFGVAFIAPSLALLAIWLWRHFRISPVVIPIAIVGIYLIASSISGFSVYRLSYMLYGDSSFTGRRTIWEFALHQVSKHPILGWGYQSFWHVGSDAPSVVEAPGWVKVMPNAHNGYIDTLLETGWVGFIILLVFIGATLHASRHMIDRDRVRAWLALSLSYFIMMSNGLETTWVRAFEFMWVAFFFVAVEIGRHSQAFRWKQRPRAVSSPPRGRLGRGPMPVRAALPPPSRGGQRG